MSHRTLAKEFWIGALAGLAGSWAMAKAQPKLKEVSKRMAPPEPAESEGNPEDSATLKAAQQISCAVLRHPLPNGKKELAGSWVHYGFGTSAGIFYGIVTRFVSPGIPSGLGYGIAVWLVADNWVAPKMGWAKAPRSHPLDVHLYALGSHLVYGAALGASASRLARLARLAA